MTLTLPKSRLVNGVMVRKQPVGRYLEAFEELSHLPLELLGALFPEEKPGDAVKKLAAISADTLPEILCRALGTCPRALVAAVCRIASIDEKTAVEKLTPKELSEVLLAFWELNDLSGFFLLARSLTSLTQVKAVPK